jgi:hypothetical protein
MEQEKVNDNKMEQRDHEAYNYWSEHGKSTVIIKCPFCQEEVLAYVWSLAGSGKKCKCGAKSPSGDVRGTEPSHTGTENCYGEYDRVSFEAHKDVGGCSKILHKCKYDEKDFDLYYYCPKVSNSERHEGVEKKKTKVGHNRFDKCKKCGKYILQNQNRPSACKCENPEREDNTVSGNFHPTVKPQRLLKHILNLFKIPDRQIVLDPFLGSGSTVIAAIDLKYDYIGIEINPEYVKIAEERIEYSQKQEKLF